MRTSYRVDREALTLGDATFGNVQANDGRVKLLLVGGQLSSCMQYPAYWNYMLGGENDCSIDSKRRITII
jgi:hypothetical protein